MESAKLISVQVGLPAMLPGLTPEDKEWRSAILKKQVGGPVWLGAEGLEGDAQADRRVHGGPERAANVYPSEHYEIWRATPGLETMSGGGFGENFTTLGLMEDTVCIGDVFQVGEVVVQVTQPRGPCEKLNRLWRSRDLMRRSMHEGRIGWYFAVRQQGSVCAGDSIILLERSFPEWTIARVWALQMDPSDKDALRALAEVPALGSDWRASILKKVRA
jgi:MOSC domain-containing protein YiiM